MPSSSDHVRLQVLVRKDARNARAIADLEAALRALGFEVTGTGKASISARATRETFTAVFGDVPPAASYRARGTLDRELMVPPALAGYVESISVAPRHSTISPKGRS
jgi:hypothetical protein